MSISTVELSLVEYRENDIGEITSSLSMQTLSDGSAALIGNMEQKLFCSGPRKSAQFDENISHIRKAINSRIDGTISFAEMSTLLSDSFLDTFEKYGLGGAKYLVIAHARDTENQDQLYLTLLEGLTSPTLSPSLRIELRQLLDLSKYIFSVKIPLDPRLLEGTSKDATVITVKTQNHSRRLRDIIATSLGLEITSTSKRDTNRLISTISAAATALEGDEPFDVRLSTRESIKSAIQNELKNGQTTIKSISDAILNLEHIENNAELVELLHTHSEFEPEEAITVDSKGLKNLTRFQHSSRRLTLTFDMKLINNGITYDAEHNRLIIDQIPIELQRQLEQACGTTAHSIPHKEALSAQTEATKSA